MSFQNLKEENARLAASGQIILFTLTAVICIALSGEFAFALEKKFQWSTRITVSEQYDDNINLTADDGGEEDDWITTVGPGLTLSVLFEETEISLNYDLDFSYYLKNDENNNVRHNLELSGLQDIPIADLFDATSDEKGKLRASFSSDGVHLNNAGYRKVAYTIYYDVIESILERWN